MNPEYMARMGAKELEAYAQAMGFSTAAGKDAAAKVEIINGKRERKADMTVLGVDLSVPIKRAHDKRVNDLLNKRGRTDADVMEAFRILLGEDQMAELTKAATDEDGTYDEVAMAFAFNQILSNKQLKNF